MQKQIRVPGLTVVDAHAVFVGRCYRPSGRMTMLHIVSTRSTQTSNLDQLATATVIYTQPEVGVPLYNVLLDVLR